MQGEKRELESKIERYRELLREYSEGPTHDTIVELIEELEEELRAFAKQPSN
jgi:Zn-dependent M32 family carboxypeptidase